MILFEGKYNHSLDVAKIAKECLKNLTGEDLFQLSNLDGPQMRDYEERYNQIQGSGAESELAKLILRYQNEGKSANQYQNAQ